MHSWATAVEIVDTFVQSGLKASDPNSFDSEWDYFFLYTSAALAIEEGAPVPDAAPTSKRAVQSAMKEIDGKRLVDRIESWSRTMNENLIPTSGGKYFILSLDFDNDFVEVSQFLNAAAADEACRQVESNRFESRDSVFVAGDGISEIKAAYPNYFIDSRRFTDHMKHYTHGN